MGKNYLILESNIMSHFTLRDIESLNNVKIFHHRKVTGNRFIDLLFNIHTSGKINKVINLPFKSIWNSILFNRWLKLNTPDYIIITASWYSDNIVSFFRQKKPKAKLFLRFTDKVSRGLYDVSELNIEKLRRQFDDVFVYSEEDSKKYNFTYLSVGYSALPELQTNKSIRYDVVFIGADKGRLVQIRNAYKLFTEAGLSCFFYVAQVKQSERINDGIIYADRSLSFLEYLSYEMKAKCIFEIVQEGSTGRTYRMLEAIIYNKYLITNCKEILSSKFYVDKYVMYYEKLEDIVLDYIKNASEDVNFEYNGEFSPLCSLEFIENNY